jgi:hypothetical protein
MLHSPSLKKNIKATLAYYDVLEFPLTTFEAWKFLMNYHQDNRGKVSLALVHQKLEELLGERQVESLRGFWFLPSRETLVQKRITREKISVKKLKGMKKLVFLLSHLPFIRMIAATGSLSFRHANKGSDWDMLVVMKKGNLFTGRAILTFFLHSIGKRRHGARVEDRACLNYYCTDQSLAVEPKDWYGAHEYQLMVPLFQSIPQDAFMRANGWILKLRPHARVSFVDHRFTYKPTKISCNIQRWLENIFQSRALEKKLQYWQLKKIAKNPKTKKTGSFIVANDERLVFFPEPRGPKVFEEFHKRLTF